jgi:hypothetical protein
VICLTLGSRGGVKPSAETAGEGWPPMSSAYLCLPERSRRDVLRDLIARAQVELQRTRDPAGRRHIEEVLRQLEDEWRSTPQ